MPQSAPIAGESEGKLGSDAIPKEDDDNRPTSNPGIYNGVPGWLTTITTLSPGLAAVVSPAMGVPLEGPPPSVPVKDSQRSSAIRPSSSSFRK